MKKYSCLLLVLVLAAFMPLNAQGATKFIDNDTLQKVKAELLQKLGEGENFRIERGVEQVAGLWRESDGNAEAFASFCRENFVAAGTPLEDLFQKLEFYSEALGGHFGEMSLDKDQPVDHFIHIVSDARVDLS